MNHNLHLPEHARGPLAVARARSFELITEPEIVPVVGECLEQSVLIEPPNGARLRVRMIRWGRR